MAFIFTLIHYYVFMQNLIKYLENFFLRRLEDKLKTRLKLILKLILIQWVFCKFVSHFLMAENLYYSSLYPLCLVEFFAQNSSGWNETSMARFFKKIPSKNNHWECHLGLFSVTLQCFCNTNDMPLNPRTALLLTKYRKKKKICLLMGRKQLLKIWTKVFKMKCFQFVIS